MSGHVVETTSELSAFMKAGVMAGSERDAGFCSGGDEDDMSGLHSPSASEDSVEVQVIPISLRNKRKLAEPRKIQEQSTAPLKKRRFEQIEETVVVGEHEESRTVRSPSPFRPWSTNSSKSNEPKNAGNAPTVIAGTVTSTAGAAATTSLPCDTVTTTTVTSSVTTSSSSGIGSGKEDDNKEDERRRQEAEETEEEVEEEIRRRHEVRIQEEVLLRLRESNNANNHRPESPVVLQLRSTVQQRRESRSQRFEPPPKQVTLTQQQQPKFQEEPLALVLRGEVPRVPSHPAVSGSYDRSPIYPLEHTTSPSSRHRHQTPPPLSHQHHPSQHHHRQNHHPQNHQQPPPPPPSSQHSTGHQTTSSATSTSSRHHQGGQQRNYKNMTRERRIEANARERTRVHTISAAFDTLRRAIPAYSHNQKLSKLSVLRIACSYIMTLSKIVNTQDGESSSAGSSTSSSSSLAACVDLVSRTIQTEGKLRKRKDD